MHKDSPFSTPSPTLVIYCLFDDSLCDRCEVLSHCGFDLHFPDEWWWASFHVSAGHLYVSFEKMSIKALCPFLILLFIFLYLFVLVLCIFWIITPCYIYIWKYLLLFSKWPFHFVDGFLCHVKTFKFDLVPFIFASVSLVWGDRSKIILLRPRSKSDLCFLLGVLRLQVLYLSI